MLFFKRNLQGSYVNRAMLKNEIEAIKTGASSTYI